MGQAVDTNNLSTAPAGAAGDAPGDGPTGPTIGAGPRRAKALSLSDLKAIVRKGGTASSDDPFWVSRHFYRKFTVYVTWLCIKLGVSSNAATFISGLAIFAGAACYAAPSKWAWLAGALLVQL